MALIRGSTMKSNIDFYVTFGMILKEEADLIMTGQAKIENGFYVDPKGEKFQMYKGRAEAILADRLLEIPEHLRRK